MEILSLLRQRYTTKVYDPRFDLSAEELAAVREILRLSPSAINSQPWAFQLIGRGELKDQLASHAMMNRERVEQASHLAIIYTFRDQTAFEAARREHLSDSGYAFYEAKVASQGPEAVATWMRCQAYIALGVLLTGVAALGIDSTPMEGIDLPAFDRILGQQAYRPVLAVALGKRSPDDPNQLHLTPKRRLEDVFL